MLRFIRQMVKLPIEVFVFGMETMGRTMRELQQVFNDSVDVMTDEVSTGTGRVSAEAGGHDARACYDCNRLGDDPNERDFHNPQEMEDAAMQDRELGGSKVTTIEYYIKFTKPNHQKTIKNEIFDVNYATSPVSVGGRLLSNFWTNAGLGRENAALRRLLDTEYDGVRHAININQRITLMQVAAAPDIPWNWTIKDEDKKYIEFDYKVVSESTKQAAEYDRQQVEALRDIKKAIDDAF